MSEIIQAFEIALRTVSDPFNFLLVVLAVLLGLSLGMMPGLGGVVTIALLIPLTFGLEPTVAFMIFAAALGGVNFGGSVTAILLNTPGAAPNAATILDGYPMARKGEGGRAIAASAVSSVSGAVFGLIVLVLSIPLMRSIITVFGPPEIFWLAVWGLTVVAIIVRGDMLSGLIAGGFGLLVAMHGQNHLTATIRWTYGQTFLLDGFKLVPSLIGLFAVAEMISLVAEGGSISQESETVEGGRMQGIRDVIEHKWIFLRSAVVGAVIGIIPGIGGTAANYIAYFQAAQTSGESEKFGTGDVRGVIASEASNDAKDGTAFLPTLGLGIPGSASMAVLLGAFILHGITPGPLLIKNNLDIVTTIIVALLISNFLTSLIGMLAVNKLVYVTKIDTDVLAPLILAVAFLGTYAINNNVFDLYITLLFGIVGFVMIRMNVSRVPFVLALVLGPLAEENFLRSLQLSRGSYQVFFDSAASIVLVLAIVVSFFIPWIRSTLQARVVDV